MLLSFRYFRLNRHGKIIIARINTTSSYLQGLIPFFFFSNIPLISQFLINILCLFTQ
ncbi:unnamed protein product [Spodoptera exigua]|nr:unnamed protein product [Spodoptera exigua]